MSQAVFANPVPAAKRPRIPQDPLYHPPAIAWPTLLLFAIATGLWLLALTSAIQGWVHPALAIGLQTVAGFMQFTVLHDGVHRSLLRGYPRLNNLISAVAGTALGFLGASAAFRYTHFKHHRLTNERGEDPDLWSGHGRAWTLPLQWATADLYYGYVILKDWSTIPMRERIEIVVGVTVLAAAFAALVWLGYGSEALLYWLLPARLSILWLAFAFNYLPHHPHTVEQRHNPYAATNVREGADAAMKWLFLYQNYHLIHHLYPSVPFYRYLKIWRQNRADFVTQGAPVVAWYALNPQRGS